MAENKLRFTEVILPLFSGAGMGAWWAHLVLGGSSQLASVVSNYGSFSSPIWGCSASKWLKWFINGGDPNYLSRFTKWVPILQVASRLPKNPRHQRRAAQQLASSKLMWTAATICTVHVGSMPFRWITWDPKRTHAVTSWPSKNHGKTMELGAIPPKWATVRKPGRIHSVTLVG